MTPQFKQNYNAHVKSRYRRWLTELRLARMTKDNERFWYVHMLVRMQRERYMWNN